MTFSFVITPFLFFISNFPFVICQNDKYAAQACIQIDMKCMIMATVGMMGGWHGVSDISGFVVLFSFFFS